MYLSKQFVIVTLLGNPTYSIFDNVLFKLCERPLRRHGSFASLTLIRLDESLVFLVNGIIGQVREHISRVMEALVVFLCGETCKSLLVDVDSQGVHRGDGDIDPEIELEPIDK